MFLKELNLQTLLLLLVPAFVSPAVATAAASGYNASAASIETDLLHFSYELEHMLDSSKLPCQDFYGYVCTRDANISQPLREQRVKHEQQRFEKFLTGGNTDELLNVDLKLKNFYKSCQTTRSVNFLQDSMLYKTIGGWPALEPTKHYNLTWMELLANFHEIGAAYFFETSISMKSNKRIVQLEPDNSRRHTMCRFEQLMVEVMHNYGLEQSRLPIVSLEVLSLERSRRDVVKTDVKDNQLEFKYSDFKRSTLGNMPLVIGWDSYFKHVLGKTLQSNDTIVIKQMPKLVNFFQILHNTSLSRLLNWIWINYLMDITDLDCQKLVEIYMPDVFAHVLQRVDTDRREMAQMYANLDKVYKEQICKTVWIDEISKQSSQRFLSRIMHLTLNGDEQLDAIYHELLIGNRNFYRNLEKLQRFQAQQKKRQQLLTLNTAGQAALEYAKIFRVVNMLLDRQKLRTPLNYVLVAEHFTRSLLAAGSSNHIPGSWRSMDSDWQFGSFQNCTARDPDASAVAKFNPNDLILGLLAQRQAWRGYTEWLSKESAQLRLLSVGRLKLSLQQLYFIGSLLVDCEQGALQQKRQRQLVHAKLSHSPEFSESFGCRTSDTLHVQQRCNFS